MKKILLIVAIILAGLNTLLAQEKGHYLSVSGGVGQSGFMYTLDNGSLSRKLGYSAELRYSYFITPNVGIGTGVQLSSYDTRAKLNSYQAGFDGLVDDEGDSYTKLVTLSDWKERQQTTFIEVPLMVQFQQKFGSKQRFGMYAGMGAKIQISLSSKYEATSGSAGTSGYYPQWNVLLYDLPQHGFGTVSDWQPSGSYKLKPSYAATAELGGLFTLNNRLDLLVGGYVDYGLNDIKKDNKGTLVQQEAGANTYVGMLSSDVVSKVNTLSFGGKLALRIRLGSKKNAPTRVENMVEPIQLPLQDKPIETEAKPEQEAESVEPLPTVQPDYSSVSPILRESISKRINFELGSAELSGKSRALLDEKVSIMKLYPDLSLTIVGYTCDLGTQEENKEIGLERAQAAKQFMVRRGIAPARLEVISRSDSNPLLPNTSEENRVQNRRVEFILNE